MKATLNEISDQLHLCAALMSDPHIIRTQSHVVASQFVSAARRIEQLQTYLVKPGGKTEKPWFDKSILSGVSHLVDATLNRHMMPLQRTYTFPKIFQKGLELYVEGLEGENMVEREIKETNCMGAMVLLYYYLHWHLMLILLNRKHHPALFEGGVNDESAELDLKKDFLDKLPKHDQLLDYRRFNNVHIQHDEKGAADKPKIEITFEHGAAKGFMIDPKALKDYNVNDKGIYRRNSNSIKIFKRVVFDVLTNDGKEGDFDEVKTGPLLYGLLAKCIILRAKVSGGALSSFDLQDDIAKWEDMYKKFEVQSASKDEHEKGLIVYAYRLAKILQSEPYYASKKAFQNDAFEAVVYDYGSITLMIDISKSLIKLRDVLEKLIENNDTDINGALGNFLLQTYESNTHQIQHYLSEYDVASRDSSEFHLKKYIQPIISWHKPTSDVGDIIDVKKGSFMIDNLNGMYWGSRASEINVTNHHYFACPSWQIDLDVNSGILPRLQTLLSISHDKNRENVLQVFTALHRNSLFVRSMFDSLMKFTDEYRRVCFNTDIRILRTSIFMPRIGDDAINLNNPEVIFGKVDDGLDLTHIGDGAEIERTAGAETVKNLKTIRLDLRKEYDALNSYVEEIKKGHFNKYPGISWPIKYGAGNTNFDKFERIRALPEITPSLDRSAFRVANILDEMKLGQIFRPGGVAGNVHPEAE